MVKREQKCCAFLTFKLREDADATRLAVVAPEAAREDADLLFEPFLSLGAAKTTCACTATAPTKGAITNRSPSGRGIGAVAAATATGALACAACCVLPLAMPAVMLTAAGGMIAWLAGAAVWVAGLALIAVTAGWIWLCWQSARTKITPAKSTLDAMSVATVVLALAFGWPLYEAALLRIVMSVQKTRKSSAGSGRPTPRPDPAVPWGHAGRNFQRCIGAPTRIDPLRRSICRRCEPRVFRR